jgi:hypothetical protein
MMQFRARWEPDWFNHDWSLRTGWRSVFGFHRPHLLTMPGYDLVFYNTMCEDCDYRWATVESIEHADYGALIEVDTWPFGQYTFTFADGRWATIEAEEGPGIVNAASADLAEALARPGAGGYEGWSLDVTLSDLAPADPDEQFERRLPPRPRA